MDKKYEIESLNVCTFRFVKEGIIPNLNDFPDRRLCVIDNTRKKAIDINLEVEYDYLETTSILYFINGASKKIRENKRAALFPMKEYDLNEQIIKKADNIIKKLKSGYEYIDGNDAFDNNEYLEKIESEKNKSSKKKIFTFKK